ncbi:MAG: amino acid-binding protein [Burkholderiaceae bacterium]|nr:amino acid-binding protein [Burkholderiaceae bacterium]
MGLFVESVDVWAAPISDRPGALAEALKALSDAGADLQCIISRRAPDQPGKGVVFVTPLQGDGEIAAAGQVGFSASHTVHSVRVMGRDRPGIAASIALKIAQGGINMRGFSSVVLGTQFIAYIALDSREDAERVIRALTQG